MIDVEQLDAATDWLFSLFSFLAASFLVLFSAMVIFVVTWAFVEAVIEHLSEDDDEDDDGSGDDDGEPRQLADKEQIEEMFGDEHIDDDGHLVTYN